MEPPRSHRAMIFKGWMFHSYVYHGYRLLISQIYIYDSYWFIMCFTSPFTCPITAIPMSEKKRMLSNSTSWKSSPSPTNLHAQDVAAVAILATFQLLRVFHAPAQMLMALGFALAFVGFWVLCLGLVDVRKELRWCIDCPDALIEWRWLVQLNNWHCGFSLTITNTQKDSN